MGGEFSGEGHVVSEEAPLIRTTILSLTSAIQRTVVTLHTVRSIDCVTVDTPQNNPRPDWGGHGLPTE